MFAPGPTCGHDPFWLPLSQMSWNHHLDVKYNIHAVNICKYIEQTFSAATLEDCKFPIKNKKTCNWPFKQYLGWSKYAWEESWTWTIRVPRFVNVLVPALIRGNFMHGRHAGRLICSDIDAGKHSLSFGCGNWKLSLWQICEIQSLNN